MNEKPIDVAGALLEVRHAYRLLHAYHQRLSDLMKLTNESLVEMGLGFERWEPNNVWLPRSKRPFFDHWAWDLTPAYQAQCVWGGKLHGSHCKVYILVIADTGYDPSSDGEPDPGRFKPVEATSSEVWVGMYRTKSKRPDWNASWELFKKMANRKDGNDHQVKVGEDEYTHRFFDLNLTELADKAAIKAKLLRPIEQWLPGA